MICLKAYSFFFGVKDSSKVSPYPVMLVTLISFSLAALTTFCLWVLFREGFYYSLLLLLPLYVFIHFLLVGLKTLFEGWS
jgi:hypothetical protein